MSNLNNLISAFSADAWASRPSAPWRFASAACLAAIPLIVILTMGIRPDFQFYLATNGLLIASALTVTLVSFPFLLATLPFGRPILRIAVLLVPALLALFTLLSPGSTLGRVEFTGSARYEYLIDCFAVGIFTSGAAFFMTRLIILKNGPVLSLFTRIIFSGVCTLTGMLALYLTCPISNLQHVVLAHLGHAVILSLFASWIVDQDHRKSLKNLMDKSRLDLK